MHNQSERNDPKLKPRFKRLSFLMRRRREEARESEWFTTADEEGMVRIHPGGRR